jgi:hypothetical protein
LATFITSVKPIKLAKGLIRKLGLREVRYHPESQARECRVSLQSRIFLILQVIFMLLEHINCKYWKGFYENCSVTYKGTELKPEGTIYYDNIYFEFPRGRCKRQHFSHAFDHDAALTWNI